MEKFDTQEHLDPTRNYGGKTKGLDTLKDLGYSVPEYIVIPHDDSNSIPKTVLDSDSLWAVRSSANVEDSLSASFAGQFLSHIGVHSSELENAVKSVRQSISSQSVAEYCTNFDINHRDIEMHVIIQRFEEPITSGVWMGRRGEGGRLEWVDGRGELLVGGYKTPYNELYDRHGLVVSSDTSPIVDERGRKIADVCLEIEERLDASLDIEFCVTESGLKFLQLRPVTTELDFTEQVEQDINNETLIGVGEGASQYIGEGIAYRKDLFGSDQWRPGSILVAPATTPEDMLMIMTSSGVVTELGGRLSHAAVVCRELGKACIVGFAIENIEHETNLRIDGKSGEVNRIRPQ